MLRDRGQALVEDEFQRLMICADDEGTTPQIWAPMAHCLHQPDEFPLVSGQPAVSWWEGATEERDDTIALVKNGTNAGARSVALSDEAGRSPAERAPARW